MTETSPTADPIAGVDAALEGASDASDEARLQLLEELYSALEVELDRGVEPTGPTGP